MIEKNIGIGIANLYDEPLTKFRFLRLRKATSLLGEPDIITVSKIKSTSTFFSKQKKTQQTIEYFLTGVLFPTTAHFSTYISSKYQTGDLRNVFIRARLLMFDAFQQKDIHVQINIPGSLEVKCYNLQGQAFQSKSEDFERAYFSSFLRCLAPFNYPKIILYPFVYKMQNYRQILKNFVPFSFKNTLALSKRFRSIKTLYFQEQKNKQSSNLLQHNTQNYALQIVVNFCLQNKFFPVLQLILDLIQKQKEKNDYGVIITYYMKLKQNCQAAILSSLAEKLLTNPNQLKFEQLQIMALFQAKKYKQAKFLGQHLIHKGGTHHKIYHLICQCSIQLKQNTNFLKTLNTILTLSEQDQKYIQEVVLSSQTKIDYGIQLNFNKGDCISNYPELCFHFDNLFINRQKKYKLFKQALKQQQVQKDNIILNLIDRLDKYLSPQFYPKYYDLLISLQKNKGWHELVKIRNQCFWLESDFMEQSKSMYSDTKKGRAFQSSASNLSINLQSPKEKGERSYTSINLNHLQSDKIQGQMKLEQSFDGELSEVEDNQNLQNMPACSKRVTHNSNTARRKVIQFKKTQVKVLCNPSLQSLFVMLYEDLKLQIDVQKWAIKLDIQKIMSFSPQKRELFAIIFLKKGLLHKKLCRYRKCQESMKLARRISQSIMVLFVSTYQLINLYILTKNLKGVQFYVIDMIKILRICQIQKFDIVPEWAKHIINFVLNLQGMDILRKISGQFKQLVLRWLRNYYTQQSLFKKQIHQAQMTFTNLKQ